MALQLGQVSDGLALQVVELLLRCACARKVERVALGLVARPLGADDLRADIERVEAAVEHVLHDASGLL